jgi:hypothetical protein
MKINEENLPVNATMLIGCPPAIAGYLFWQADHIGKKPVGSGTPAGSCLNQA